MPQHPSSSKKQQRIAKPETNSQTAEETLVGFLVKLHHSPAAECLKEAILKTINGQDAE
jgi:hypothetical protein